MSDLVNEHSPLSGIQCACLEQVICYINIIVLAIENTSGSTLKTNVLGRHAWNRVWDITFYGTWD